MKTEYKWWILWIRTRFHCLLKIIMMDFGNFVPPHLSACNDEKLNGSSLILFSAQTFRFLCAFTEQNQTFRVFDVIVWQLCLVPRVTSGTGSQCAASVTSVCQDTRTAAHSAPAATQVCPFPLWAGDIVPLLRPTFRRLTVKQRSSVRTNRLKQQPCFSV